MPRDTAPRPLRSRLIAFAAAAVLALTMAPAGAAAAAPADLPVAGTVSGTVTDSVTGLGIAGVNVTLQNGPFSSVGTSTDLDGNYGFTDVAFGNYQVVFFVSAGYTPQFATVFLEVSALSPDADADMAFTPFASGTSAIVGVVTDSQSGLPIDAWLSLSGVDVAYSGNAAAWGGSYGFTGLAAGTYSYSVSANGYVGQFGQVTISEATETTLNLSLIPRNASITGRVTDPDGNGIPGLWVNAFAPEIGGGGGETDADGYYTIAELGPGEYQVSLGGSPTPWVAQEVSVTAVANEAVVKDIVMVARTSSQIFGAVFDQNHYGIKGICIDLLDAATGAVVDSVESWVDAVFGWGEVADGTYTLHLEDCALDRPRIYGSIYLGGGTSLGDAETFTIHHPADDIRIDDIFLVGPETGSIIVSARDSVTGDPVIGFTATMNFDGDDYQLEDWTGSGDLPLDHLLFGEYGFQVSAPGYLQSDLSVVTIDSTTPYQMIEVDLIQGTATSGSITISVRDEATGDPIGNVKGYYVLDHRHHKFADADGTFTTSNLAFGTYSFVIDAPGYHRATVPVTISANSPNVSTSIELSSPGHDKKPKKPKK